MGRFTVSIFELFSLLTIIINLFLEIIWILKRHMHYFFHGQPSENQVLCPLFLNFESMCDGKDALVGPGKLNGFSTNGVKISILTKINLTESAD